MSVDMVDSASMWSQTTTFTLVSDKERTLKRKVTMERSATRCSTAVPAAWTHAQEGEMFAVAVGAIFAVHSKCNGDDAVIVVDGNPPVAVLNPFLNMETVPFADVVRFIQADGLASSMHSDRGRNEIARQLESASVQKPLESIGFAAIVSEATLHAVGIRNLGIGFDFVWVVNLECTLLVECTLLFNSSVYDASTATSLVHMLTTVLSAPDLARKTLREINILDADMIQKIMTEWQPDTFPEAEYMRTLPDIFSDTMRSVAPDAPAVIEAATGRTISYAELDGTSSRIAVFIQTQLAQHRARFGIDATCGIYLPRCADWYVVMLGVLKAGGAYLSLDPEFPPNRLSYAIEESDAICLFTLSTMPRLDYHGVVFHLDALWADILAIDLALKKVEETATPHSPAYLIYTSGSTGKPKGVLIEHVNAVNFVVMERLTFKLSSKHRIIQGFSTSFDASVEEIWLAFASGSALFPVDKYTLADRDAIQAFLRTNGITVWSTVPTLLATLDAAAVSTVQLMIVGGEVCNKEVVAVYSVGRTFVNTYGPTETTVICTSEVMAPNVPVTIGRACMNYFAMICDPNQQLLPPGVPGEPSSLAQAWHAATFFARK